MLWDRFFSPLKSKPVKVITISGGSGSGKTTLAHMLRDKIGYDKAALIGQDSYYYDQSNKVVVEGEGVNFDHPSALEFSLLAKHLSDLKKGKTIQIPIYDYVNHARTEKMESLTPHPYIIVDGTLVLSQEQVREYIDFAVFLDVPEEIRFQRRLKRDIRERGRSEEGVRNQFYNQVKPMHDQYVQPSKSHADLILPTEYDELEAVKQILKQTLAKAKKSGDRVFDKTC